MRHRKTYLYVDFQQNRVSRSVKTVHTDLLAKKCKLHKFATCNLNFEKSRLSDMHYPLTDIQANFEVRYRNTTKINYFHRRQTDGRTDRRHDGHADGQTLRVTTIGSLSSKKKEKN